MKRPYNRRPSGALVVVCDQAEPPHLGELDMCEIGRMVISNCNYTSVSDYEDIQLRDLFRAIMLLVTWPERALFDHAP